MKFLNDEIKLDDNMVYSYDEVALWAAPFGILLLENIPLQKNAMIVDIGCGTGFPILELAQRFGEGSKVFGIDPWEKALVRANKKKEQYRIKNVELINSIGEKMPFNNQEIDIVVSNLGINNFNNPTEVIKECHRILKPKGKLIFTTNLVGHFNEFYCVFQEVLHDLKLESEKDNLIKHINNRQSIDSIYNIINQNEFTVKKVVQQNYTMRFIDGASFFNHYFIKLAFLEEWKKIISSRDLNIVFTALEARLNKLSYENGELKISVPIAYIECEKL